MPPLVLWPWAALMALLAGFYTLLAASWLVRRAAAARDPEARPEALRELLVALTIAAFCWLALYRLFRPI